MNAVSPPGLLATVQYFHHYLDELLLLHQEALLERDTGLALGFWQLHGQMLRVHIEQENQWLLPALERSVVEPAWSAMIYRAEHGKILSLGDKLGQSLSVLQAAEPGGRRVFIALLDRQRSYKNVLEHHEEREEKGLLPELDAALTARELDPLISACGTRWNELHRRQRHTLSRLIHRLDAYPGHSL